MTRFGRSLAFGYDALPPDAMRGGERAEGRHDACGLAAQNHGLEADYVRELADG